MILSTFDFVLLAIILLITIKVTVAGFVHEFFSKAAIIVGAVGAILLYGRFTPTVAKLIGSNVYPEAVSFLVIFLALYLLVKLIQQLVGTAFQGESMTNLDHALGFFLGIAEGLLIVAVILILLRMQPWFDFHFLVSGSFFARILKPLIDESPGIISGIIPKAI